MISPEPLPSEFAEALAQRIDRLGPFGDRIAWYQAVSSTNDVAAVLAEQGGAEGLVVAANQQSAGRGRHGRSWASPPGAGLYVSVVLRPKAATVRLLSLGCGLAVAEGIEAAAGLHVALKWPNDVYAGARKVAGVLVEARTNDRAAIPYVIAGFGINVMPAAYPPDVAARATNLEEELGRAVDRGLLFAECISALARRYAQLQRGDVPTVIAAWRSRAGSTLGQHMRWDAAGASVEGVAETVDENGALIVRLKTGDRVRIISGEVNWIA